jgi:hypothetical protein
MKGWSMASRMNLSERVLIFSSSQVIVFLLMIFIA